MAKLYTPNQVADILQVSVPTVKRWLLNGELPGFKIGMGGHWRVRSDELAEYIDTKRRQNVDMLSQCREAADDEEYRG